MGRFLLDVLVSHNPEATPQPVEQIFKAVAGYDGPGLGGLLADVYGSPVVSGVVSLVFGILLGSFALRMLRKILHTLTARQRGEDGAIGDAEDYGMRGNTSAMSRGCTSYDGANNDA